MKRLIYDTQTGLYLTETGTWTSDEEEAKDFPSVFQALEFCCHNQITEAELVFKFERGQCQVSMPISDSAQPEFAK